MGIIVHEQTSVVFTPINDRLCMAKIKQNENKPDIVIISAYAPHTQIVEKNQEIQEEFYENLDQIISQVSNRNILIRCGDMNAKTGSEHKNHPDVVGKFGKGEANKNGMALIDICNKHELVLRNTIFQHKMKNRTTWEMPEKPNSKDKYGNVRRNPYRNQIDYVIVRRKHLLYVTNAQSYTSINTETDHRLVIMKTKIKRSSAYYCKQTKENPINYANFGTG